MPDLYPLLMKPLFDPRPWGASELGPIYPNHKFAERIGEAWLTGDNCIVANGVLAGQKLEAVTLQLGRALVGDAARRCAALSAAFEVSVPSRKTFRPGSSR